MTKVKLKKGKSKPRELGYLLKRLGSAAAVARQLKRSPSTLQRWVREGVQAKSTNVLELKALWADIKDPAKKVKRDFAVFETLRDIAKSNDVMPKFRAGSGARSGRNTEGYQWRKRISRELTPGLVESILSWFRSVKTKRYPLWQIIVLTSQYSSVQRTSDPFVGSGRTILVQFSTEIRLGDFTPEVLMTTARGKKAAVVRSMKALFKKALSDSDLRVFVHGVTAVNYRMRTRKEASAFLKSKRFRK